MGTGTAIDLFIRFIENHIKADEECLVISPRGYRGEYKDIPELDLDRPAEMKLGNPEMLFASEPDPVSLGIFCLKHVRGLPRSRIDTAFTVFHRLNVLRSRKLRSDGLGIFLCLLVTGWRNGGSLGVGIKKPPRAPFAGGESKPLLISTAHWPL